MLVCKCISFELTKYLFDLFSYNNFDNRVEWLSLINVVNQKNTDISDAKKTLLSNLC